MAVLGIAAVLFAGAGESHLDLKTNIYYDNNEVWSQAPSLKLEVAVSERVSLGWMQEVDAVSGATRFLTSSSHRAVDGVSGATVGSGTTTDQKNLWVDAISGATVAEIRTGEEFSARYDDEGRGAAVHFAMSHENDYSSYAPGATLFWDLFERNTNLSLDVSRYLDNYHPGGTWPTGGDKNLLSTNFSVGQSLTALTLVTATATYIRADGYLGRPYNPVSTLAGGLLDENMPDQRRSLALGGELVQGWLLADLLGSVNVSYRDFRDSWDLQAKTVDLKVSQHLNDELVLRLRARWHDQSGTAFAKEWYDGDELYRTADMRWFPFSSLMLGIKFYGVFPESWDEIRWLPNRWNLDFDQLWRDDPGGRQLYQLHPPDQRYMQRNFAMGVGYDF